MQNLTPAPTSANKKLITFKKSGRVMAGEFEILVAKFIAGFDFGAFVPFVPTGNENPIGIGLDGLLPEDVVNLAVEAVHIEAGVADFGVVVAGNHVHATDAVVVTGDFDSAGIMACGPGAERIGLYTFLGSRRPCLSGHTYGCESGQRLGVRS